MGPFVSFRLLSCDVKTHSVDVIETTSRQLEQGFEKVARWCSLEFRQFVRDVPLEVNSPLTEGVKWLWKRPDLLR